MCQMHATGGSDVEDNLRMDVRLRQNKLEFHEQLFLFEYGKMLLHKQLRIEGLLSPCACPVDHRTETKTSATDNRTISKADIASNLQVHINDLTLKEELGRNLDTKIEEKDEGVKSDEDTTAEQSTIPKPEEGDWRLHEIYVNGAEGATQDD